MTPIFGAEIVPDPEPGPDHLIQDWPTVRYVPPDLGLCHNPEQTGYLESALACLILTGAALKRPLPQFRNQ
jgi:hypothetical protein